MQQEERFDENETFVVENKEAIEEIKAEILEEFSKAQNMNIEERQPFLKLETNKKNKFNIRIGNIALDQVIKDIKPKDITRLSELTYSTAKSNYRKMWYEKEKQK